jgi:5-(carboxyamino)imidazole ribonucleotide synthase
VTENQHEDHILAISIAPGRFPLEVHREAEVLARAIAEALCVEGLLAVEMFLTKSGQLLVNELAPRPHNSGHFTIDACVTSQFEQHARAVCDIPLGDPRQHTKAVMVNLLGDLWPEPERAPDWSPVLRDASAKLHLYGKRVAKPGRKMGHFTLLGESIPELLLTAGRIRAQLAE